MLERFRKQTRLPDKIVCWLSEEEYNGVVPHELRKFADDGFVEIGWTSNTFSFKKYEIFKEHGKDFVFLIDDDIYYEDSYIEDMYNAALSHKDNVICCYGSNMSYYYDSRRTPLLKNPSLSSSYDSFAVCFPPNVFPMEYFECADIRDSISPKSENVFMQSLCIKNNIPIYCLNDYYLEQPEFIPGSEETALGNENRKKTNNITKNAIVFKNLIREFGIGKKCCELFPKLKQEPEVVIKCEKKQIENIEGKTDGKEKENKKPDKSAIVKKQKEADNAEKTKPAKQEEKKKVSDKENNKVQEKKNPKYEQGVSICITAYNSQDYIEECLDSVALQNWFKNHDNWEILLGIDGCEKTLLKVKDIMHKYRNLRVFMMDRNVGTYITSNTIIKQSKYKYVLRFDSDDKMRPDMVGMGFENISKYDMIRFSFENFGNEYIQKRKYNIAHGVVMFNKKIFDKLGGYMPYRCGCDTDIIRRFTCDGSKIYEDHRISFDRRIHENSLTQDRKTNMTSSYRKKINDILKSTDYSSFKNRISNFIIGDFTEIKKDDCICKNIINLKNATNKDIEEFLKNRARKSKFNLQIDFENPKTIQDKLHWLMVYDKNKMLKSKCADKILLHEYSVKKLGKDICVPIIDVYDKPEDIDFDKLPDKYVLKCNHGYAMNIICKDNKTNNFLNIKNRKINTRKDCIDYLNSWLNTNFGDMYYQWHYALIKPKCYSEVFMNDGHESLVDYKVWCCNGDPKMIMVISDRYSNNLHENIYDINWNIFDIGWSCARQDFNNLDKKPDNLVEMIDCSKKLSEDFDFVRVDFYIIGNKLYLGELTFSPNGGIFGCKDYETSLYWGNMINITSF